MTIWARFWRWLFPPPPLTVAQIEELARQHVRDHALHLRELPDDHVEHLRAHIEAMDTIIKKETAI